MPISCTLDMSCFRRMHIVFFAAHVVHVFVVIDIGHRGVPLHAFSVVSMVHYALVILNGSWADTPKYLVAPKVY